MIIKVMKYKIKILNYWLNKAQFEKPGNIQVSIVFKEVYSLAILFIELVAWRILIEDDLLSLILVTLGEGWLALISGDDLILLKDASVLFFKIADWFDFDAVIVFDVFWFVTIYCFWGAVWYRLDFPDHF